MKTDLIVSVANLSKTFFVPKRKALKDFFKKKEVEEIAALKDINLTIKKGEFVALLGPNGAGKSTLIKILIGAMAFNKGTVEVLGQPPLENREEIISKIGVVFGQRSRLWYDLAVAESFEMTKRLYIEGYKKNADKILTDWENYLIDSIDIRKLLDRQVKKLSLGEKMRCELVNTLLYNPELIFLDEPTIGLDVISKQKIREALSILNTAGKTILLTSHDTGDIEKLCSRVVVINHGEVAVDLKIDDFMKLNDEDNITARFLEKVTQAMKEEMQEMLSQYKGSITSTNEYEINLIIPKENKKIVLKALLDKFNLEDIKFASEGIEKILVDLYKKDSDEIVKSND